MKTRTKALLLSLCAIALVAVTVMGTLAYLTAEEKVTNTFTVGDVQIKLEETAVDETGTPVEPAAKTEEGNQYHLIPGQTYTKDPTVTVLNGSETSYVRMLVTLNNYADLQEIFDNNFKPENFVAGWDKEVWPCVGITVNGDTATYEFRHTGTVAKNGNSDTLLPELFTSFTCPGTLNNDDLKKLSDFKIDVVAHAIQATTFEDADEAWAAFDEQKAIEDAKNNG